MAAPPEKTIQDLTGSWTMNKTLSDDTDAILQLQGIGWIIRKAIGMMTVTLNIKEYKDAEGVYHIDIEQPGAAGIKGTSEGRTLDGAKRDHEDHVFGAVVGHTSWIKLDALNEGNADEAFLKKDWDAETAAAELVDSNVESVKNGWTARQLWGFQTMNVKGESQRRYTRQVVVKKGDKTLTAKLVYDFLSQK